MFDKVISLYRAKTHTKKSVDVIAWEMSVETLPNNLLNLAHVQLIKSVNRRSSSLIWSIPTCSPKSSVYISVYLIIALFSTFKIWQVKDREKIRTFRCHCSNFSEFFGLIWSFLVQFLRSKNSTDQHDVNKTAIVLRTHLNTWN